MDIPDSEDCLNRLSEVKTEGFLKETLSGI